MEFAASTFAELAGAFNSTMESAAYAKYWPEMPNARDSFSLPTVSDKVLGWVRIGEVATTVLISFAALYATWSIRSINDQTNIREKSERVRNHKEERTLKLVDLANVMLRHRELFENTKYPISDEKFEVIAGFDIGDIDDDRTKKRSKVNYVIVRKVGKKKNAMSFTYRGEYEVESTSINFEKTPGLHSDLAIWDEFIDALGGIVNRNIAGLSASITTNIFSERDSRELSKVTGLNGKVRGFYSMNIESDRNFKDAIVGVNLSEVISTKQSISHIEARDTGGRTFLHYAVHDAYDRLWNVPQYESSENGKDKRDLRYAEVMQNDLDKIINILIQLHADVNAQDNFGSPVIYLAAAVGNVRAIQQLASHGVDVDAESEQSGMNALQMSSFSGSFDVVRILLDCDADVNRQDALGQTPLHFAISYLEGEKRLEIISLLMSKNPNIHIKDKKGLSPEKLMINLGIDKNDFSEILNECLKRQHFI